MGYQEELARLQEAKSSMRQSIINKGVEVPEEAKIEDYPEYIAQIQGGGGYDPNNPTLDGLKAAIDAGDYDAFPVGTEIPDTYDGNSNPLIVAQYLDSTNNSAYGGAEGVILVRKYVEPTSIFGSNREYVNSTVQALLNATYYNNCSSELKEVISDITIPYFNSSSIITIANQKWFLMSAYELCSMCYGGSSGYEGIMWDLWKQKTGLSSPSAIFTANSGRIMRNRSDSAQIIWLRSMSGSSEVATIQINGACNVYNAPGSSYGVLPACFIAKD